MCARVVPCPQQVAVATGLPSPLWLSPRGTLLASGFSVTHKLSAKGLKAASVPFFHPAPRTFRCMFVTVNCTSCGPLPHHLLKTLPDLVWAYVGTVGCYSRPINSTILYFFAMLTPVDILSSTRYALVIHLFSSFASGEHTLVMMASQPRTFCSPPVTPEVSRSAHMRVFCQNFYVFMTPAPFSPLPIRFQPASTLVSVDCTSVRFFRPIPFGSCITWTRSVPTYLSLTSTIPDP